MLSYLFSNPESGMNDIAGNNKNWIAQANFYLLGGFLFFLPFFQKASVICVGAMLLLWLGSGNVKISLARIKKNKIILWFLLFYMIHIFGLIYTSNFSFAIFDLESKFTFLLFPFLFSAYIFSKEKFNMLLWVFISGCVIGAILCFIIAYSHYLSDHAVYHFYYTYFSQFLHPTYFSIYLDLAIIILLDMLIDNWKVLLMIKKIVIILLCYFFFAEIILLSARTSNVVAFLTIFIFLLIRFNKDGKRLMKYMYSVLFLISVFCIQYFFLNDINRFAEVKMIINATPVSTAGNKTDQPLVENESSVNLHFKIWKNSILLASHNPLLGVGTGDVKDELANTYRKNNFSAGVSGGLNCHNQFLTTLVTLGLLGLLSLLAIYYIGIRTAIKNKDWIYFSFLMIVFLNSMTESLFEKQNGILFFAAFNMLFYLRNRIPISEHPTPNTELPTPN